MFTPLEELKKNTFEHLNKTVDDTREFIKQTHIGTPADEQLCQHAFVCFQNIIERATDWLRLGNETQARAEATMCDMVTQRIHLWRATITPGASSTINDVLRLYKILQHSDKQQDSMHREFDADPQRFHTEYASLKYMGLVRNPSAPNDMIFKR